MGQRVFTLAVRQRLAKGVAWLRCLAGSVLDPSPSLGVTIKRPRNDMRGALYGTGEPFSYSASIV